MNNNPVGDIAITTASAPSQIILGEEVDLSLTITNVGTEAVLGGFASPFPFGPLIFNNLFLSADNKFDSTDRSIDGTTVFGEQLPINPGETATLNFSATLDTTEIRNLTGNRFLIFQTSDGEFNGVEGVSTENNTFAIPVNISAPSTINGTAQANNLFGTPQTDLIQGLAGNDTIRGGDDDDIIRGGNGRDRLLGEAGNDNLFGGNGNDTLFGRDGEDFLVGDSGRDLLIGNSGWDTLSGGKDDDRLFGGDGGDNLFGNAGNDFLAGNTGRDSLFGNNGNDTLFGGKGEDTLRGGAGNDVFELTRDPNAAFDEVRDYVDGEDTFLLSDRFGLGSLNFNDLSITQINNSTQIRVAQNNELLAILENTDASQLDSSDFIVG